MRARTIGRRAVAGPEPSPSDAVAEALAELAPDDGAVRPALAALETRAARAVQGLALNRAFSRLEDAATRVRVVRLVEALAAAERRPRA